VRFSDEESVFSFHQTTVVSRFAKVQGDRSPYDGDWVYWSTRLGRDPSKPRRVTRLLKRPRGCCARCGLRFTTEDVIEVHHHDKNHHNNAFDKAFRGSSLQPASEEEWLDLGANLEENFEVMEAHLCQIEG